MVFSLRLRSSFADSTNVDSLEKPIVQKVAVRMSLFISNAPYHTTPHLSTHLVILEGLLMRVTEGFKLLSVKSHTSIDPSTLPRKSIPGRVGDHRPVVR